MIKSLKSDLYKVIRQKSFWIFLILSAVVAFVTVWFTSVTNSLISNPSFPNGVDLGQKKFALNLLQEIFIGPNGILLTFQVIFTSIFICSEFSHGTIKTIISRGQNRAIYYFSKLISCFLANLCFVFVSVFVILVYGGIALGYGEFPEHFLLSNIIAILKSLGSLCFFAMIAILIRKTSSSLSISLVFQNLIGAALAILGALISYYCFNSNKDIDLLPYWVESAELSFIDSVTKAIVQEPQNLLHVVLVCVSYMIIPTAIAIWSFQERDVK